MLRHIKCRHSVRWTDVFYAAFSFPRLIPNDLPPCSEVVHLLSFFYAISQIASASTRPPPFGASNIKEWIENINCFSISSGRAVAGGEAKGMRQAVEGLWYRIGQ